MRGADGWRINRLTDGHTDILGAMLNAAGERPCIKQNIDILDFPFFL